MSLDPRWFRSSPTGRFAYLSSRLPRAPGRVLSVGNVGHGASSHRELETVIRARGGLLVGCDINVAGARHEGYANQVGAVLPELPFAGGSFDLVYLGEVLEHVWEPRLALVELRRVLRPRGLLVLDTPHVYALGRLVNWVLRGRDTVGDPDHVLLFTPAVLENLLRHAGFTVADMCTDRKLGFGRLALPWAPGGRRLGSHLCVSAIRDG